MTGKASDLGQDADLPHAVWEDREVVQVGGRDGTADMQSDDHWVAEHKSFLVVQAGKRE